MRDVRGHRGVDRHRPRGPAGPPPAAAGAPGSGTPASRPRRRGTSRSRCAAGRAGARRRRARCRGRRPACGCRCPRSTRPRSGSTRGATGSPTSKRWTVTGRGAALDLDALAGQLVEASAVDLDGRHHRRDLQDVADERRGCRPRPRRPPTPRHVPGAGDLARRRRAWTSPCRARRRRGSASAASPRKRSRRVTLPTPSSSTPVASGSSVPE